MVSTIDIFRPTGGRLTTITFDTGSYCRKEVMGENSITLIFSLPQIPNGINSGFLEIPIGSYVEYKNIRYTLYNPSDFKKNGERNYDYTLKLYSYQELLNDRIFINEPDGMQVFPRRGRPIDFIEAIVRNMNQFDTGSWDGIEWTFNPENIINNNVQQEIQFNGVTCFEALRLVAEAFKTEWEIRNKEIVLHKVEYNRSSPLRLSYGRDNGFLPGLGRANYDENRPVHKLYVKGGDRNIDSSTYGSQTLLMPKGAGIHYDGTYFLGEDGYNADIARVYRVSDDGTYLTRAGAPQTSRREAFIELTEAYPKRVGKITKIIWKYGENGTEYVSTTSIGSHTAYISALGEAHDNGGTAADVLCDVFDSNNEIDYTNLRINGEQMIFVPQTGQLSGIEINMPQSGADASEGYIHSERRFKLITESYYSGFIPDERIAVGDEYAVFGIKMPTEYIRIGENDLLREAVRYKYENEDLRFTFTGELDGIYAQKNWTSISSKIVAGGYVMFSDLQFHPEGTLIRISAIKEFLYEPYKPTLELTNIVIGGGLKSELTEIPKQEVINNVQDEARRRLEYRRWRDTEETKRNIDIMFADMGEAISASSIETMYARIGNKMGQFRFTKGQTNEIATGTPIFTYDSTTNIAVISGAEMIGGLGPYAFAQHQLINANGEFFDMDGKSATGNDNTLIRPASEYKLWTNIEPTTIKLTDKNKYYWAYLKGSKTSNVATFVIEEYNKNNPRVFDDGTNYWLIIGGISSEYEHIRSFTPLFGFTEILPGQITTGMIRSIDGNTYFDLNTSEIGGKINFKDGLISGDIAVYNGQGQITAEINGDNSNLDNIAFAAGGNGSSAPFNVNHRGEMNSTSGTIGGFDIGPNHIGSNASSGGDGGALSIYSDFIRVGATDSYAIIGANVLPATTLDRASGRLTNNYNNSNGNNYGLILNVSGGNKNVGITSNAPLVAPVFINTRLTTISFNSSYTIDFSQNNFFDCTAAQATTVSLPTESQVANMFGYNNTLPDDFGYIFTILGRTFTQVLTIEGVYNFNDVQTSILIGPGDVVSLLIKKFPSFRYQMINFHNN